MGTENTWSATQFYRKIYDSENIFDIESLYNHYEKQKYSVLAGLHFTITFIELLLNAIIRKNTSLEKNQAQYEKNPYSWQTARSLYPNGCWWSHGNFADPESKVLKRLIEKFSKLRSNTHSLYFTGPKNQGREQRIINPITYRWQ